MIRILWILFVLKAICLSQDTSFSEQQFFSNLKESYYALEMTTKKNFTALVTNISTESFAEQKWKNNEIFPVQLIWLAPGRLFISDQGFPALEDSAKLLYTEMVSDLKAQFQDILVNLKRFYFNGIFKSISENYGLRRVTEVVEISFKSYFEQDTISSVYYFGKNGLCLKIITQSSAKKITEEIIPTFKIIKTKWLISSWKVQIKKNEVIEAGYLVDLNNSLIGGVWVPSEIIITVQQSKNIGKTFQDVIKLRNYLFDQPLQFISQ